MPMPPIPLSTPAEIFSLTRELVDVDSVTGREREVGELLEGRLLELAESCGGGGGGGDRGGPGVVERMVVGGELGESDERGERGEHCEGADRFNLFASWGEPVVVLSTHMDTVPPFFPSTEDAEHIYGRGACDAKGIIAAMFAAAARLLDDGVRGFGVLLLVGEETDSAGAEVANRQPRATRYLVNGEPTENRLALGTKGALYLAVEAAGRAAHSAYPELGDSAVDRLLAALGRLRAVPLPSAPVLGETTLNIGTLAGGRAANVVADRARAEVMVRTVGDTARLRADLVAALAPVQVTEVRETPAMRLRTLPGFATTVVKYTSDIPRLGAWGEPLLLGPGSIHVAHTPEERVPKSQLVAAADLYAELVRRLLREAAEAGGRGYQDATGARAAAR
ncbi:MAG TPA: M20/M25/M40 family metallo-hydrolase [Thermoanaerobaculia bacterium]|nr:M20/M25/M40 family metallo-hydrolase [Thermoanaerobaculia bacterium]